MRVVKGGGRGCIDHKSQKIKWPWHNSLKIIIFIWHLISRFTEKKKTFWKSQFTASTGITINEEKIAILHFTGKKGPNMENPLLYSLRLRMEQKVPTIRVCKRTLIGYPYGRTWMTVNNSWVPIVVQVRLPHLNDSWSQYYSRQFSSVLIIVQTALNTDCLLTLWRNSWISWGPTVLCSVYTGLPHWFFWHTSSRTLIGEQQKSYINKHSQRRQFITGPTLAKPQSLFNSDEVFNQGYRLPSWGAFV